MADRQKFGWNVTLHDDLGTTSTREVRAYWDPERDDTPEAIKFAAQAEARAASGGKRDYFATAVERIAA